MVPAANRLDLNLRSVICRLCERREGLTGFCLTFLFRITVLTIASWTCFIWRTVGVHEMSASRLPSSRKGNRVDLIIYFSIRLFLFLSNLSWPLPSTYAVAGDGKARRAQPCPRVPRGLPGGPEARAECSREPRDAASTARAAALGHCRFFVSAPL